MCIDKGGGYLKNKCILIDLSYLKWLGSKVFDHRTYVSAAKIANAIMFQIRPGVFGALCNFSWDFSWHVASAVVNHL